MRSPSPRSRLPLALVLTGLLPLLAGCGGATVPESRVYRNSGLAAPPPRTAKPSEALELSKNFSVHGIDVSKYQGDIDWQAVADSGVSFAYIKATEGGDRADPKFRQNWEGARAAGIPRGAYHFVYWCRPWQEEMSWFERNAPAEANSLPPVLDVEATPESATCKKTLYPEETIANMRAMLGEMERHYGKRPIIYTTVDFYESILSGGGLSDYPIWVRSTKHHPSVRYGERKWHFWQYQSDGTVPGIRTAVDRNAFHGSASEWQQWLASN
jgi:lysozyme